MPKVVMRPKTKSHGFRRVINPESVMVWWGVLHSDATQIHFYNAGVKTNDEVYIAMLNNVLLLLEETVFVDEDE